MPQLVLISHPETPAVQALRRTLWQLAFVGIATAVALSRFAPDSAELAAWCVLIPLCGLVVHFRSALFNLLQAHWHAHSDHVAPRRIQKPQARHARGDGLPNKRRPSRVCLARDAARLRPLAR